MSGAPGGRRFSILLLEDNPGDVYLFRQALKGAGLDFELTVFEDGASGSCCASFMVAFLARPKCTTSYESSAYGRFYRTVQCQFVLLDKITVLSSVLPIA